MRAFFLPTDIPEGFQEVHQPLMRRPSDCKGGTSTVFCVISYVLSFPRFHAAWSHTWRFILYVRG